MNPNQKNQPSLSFKCHYTPGLAELLLGLKCSVAISTYQAGKLIFLSPKNKNSIIQLPRLFKRPMGMALDREKDKLILACLDEVVVFANSKSLALHYPPSPKKYDAIYMPRVTYHTGRVDVHDLEIGVNDKIYAVNTLFSCIMEVDSDFNFRPYWTPPFIDKLASEDRCHLNGMAMLNGKPRYATAFNQGNTPRSWKDTMMHSGVVFDLETNEVIVSGLGMPHSPRIFNDELYVLLSSTGELIKVNTENGTYEVIIKLDGFVRGMDLYQGFLFISLSKIRKDSSSRGKLKLPKDANWAGFAVVHLESKKIVGKLAYLDTVEEIYDIKILPNKIRPNILNTTSEKYKAGLMIPKTTFWSRDKFEK